MMTAKKTVSSALKMTEHALAAIFFSAGRLGLLLAVENLQNLPLGEERFDASSPEHKVVLWALKLGD